MSSFFTRLSYSFGNEDWITEPKALQIEPHHRVLCITASGDRPLHLLLNDCAELIAIDANPVQNHLLELKKIAMNNLSYKDYIGFLGVKDCKQRLNFLNLLTPSLHPETANFWLKNEKMIKKGVIYQGATELWARRLSIFIRLLRKKEINALFDIQNLEEQKQFLQDKWNHPLWKAVFNLGLNRWITTLFFKDPGTYSNFDSSIKPGSYTYERMIRCLNQSLARENPLVSIILKGKVSEDAFPPYLEQNGVEAIKKNLHKLSIKTTDVVKFLESAPENSIDRFSLSDVVSYLDYGTYQRLLAGIRRTARSGARFCMRQYMSRYEIPINLQKEFKREPHLETLLEKEDRAFVYHYIVGEIIKS
jgi:S-adenosylmethionine-diacylglycerol 3-amino-3-carboxypropyl transferase